MSTPVTREAKRWQEVRLRSSSPKQIEAGDDLLAALEAERERKRQALNRVRIYRMRAHTAEAALGAAVRRIAALEALRPWLAHRDWCSRETTGKPCDCGLAEAERQPAGGEG